ncbi:dTDP-4-dehydrorhamnose 3,5-epimerase family protein [Streptomyces sp. A5-4]|uniref:dTDP-4-dehydrorhamnose 3,5-epimerase family protein n=1 Tax=Streptomyces sp. A5-4 TaxID=3384771 RepID=UPI003DAA1292
MRIRELEIEGAVEFTPPVFHDRRGIFAAPYQGDAFEKHRGSPLFRVEQVSHNISARGVLRGLHYTLAPPGMAKYVYCPYGSLQDYLVDLRTGSPTFGRWTSTRLEADRCNALYIPVGVGHAFISLADNSLCMYVMSQGYVPEHELSIDPLDPAIGLDFPQGLDPIQSDRDLAAPSLAEVRTAGLLPAYKTCAELEIQL